MPFCSPPMKPNPCMNTPQPYLPNGMLGVKEYLTDPASHFHANPNCHSYVLSVLGVSYAPQLPFTL